LWDVLAPEVNVEFSMIFDHMTAIVLGTALAATCGLRAFLPLLSIGVLGATGHLELADAFAWMASPVALVCFGSAVIFEMAADKFPGVDHLLDLAGTIVKPVAATIASASMVTEFDPMLAVVLGLVVGGTIAEAVHLVKAKVRIATSALTVGVANPVVSIIEDVVAVLATILSFLLPIVVVTTVLSFLGGAGWWLWRRFGRATDAGAAA
jgi:hypothetical protein